MTRIRAAEPPDLPALLALAGRLADFAVPPWRTAAQVIDAEREALANALQSAAPEHPVLIAEDAGGAAVGCAYIETRTDYFTRRLHAHLSVLAVAASAEGQGVGRALIAAAEAWARERGYPLLTLNVFAGNERARTVYERLGYRPEILKYVKPLGRNSGPAGTEQPPIP